MISSILPKKINNSYKIYGNTLQNKITHHLPDCVRLPTEWAPLVCLEEPLPFLDTIPHCAATLPPLLCSQTTGCWHLWGSGDHVYSEAQAGWNLQGNPSSVFSANYIKISHWKSHKYARRNNINLPGCITTAGQWSWLEYLRVAGVDLQNCCFIQGDSKKEFLLLMGIVLTWPSLATFSHVFTFVWTTKAGVFFFTIFDN